MTRVFVDWGGDGAFVSITRPGAPAEEVRLSEADVVRLIWEVADAWLARRGRALVRAAKRPPADIPRSLIGQFGE